MILNCPSCQARYLVNPVQLGGAGRRVQCARCQHVWYQDRPAEPPPTPPTDQSSDGAPTEASAPSSGTSDLLAQGAPRPEVTAPTRTQPSSAPSTALDPPPPPPVSGQLPSTVVLSRSRVPAAFWTLLILLVVAVGLVGVVARTDVVRFYPPAIAVYEGVGLPVDRSIFEDHQDLQPALQLVGLETTIVDGGELSLSGTVANTAAESRRLRPLEVTLRDADGVALASQNIDLGQSMLDGGQSIAFDVTVETWPDGAVEAQVQLAE